MLCLGMHSNVMLRFMVQALQDAPLCSSTFQPSRGPVYLCIYVVNARWYSYNIIQSFFSTQNTTFELVHFSTL